MIYINDIPSFRDPDSFKMTLDDRISKVEIIGGVAIQDLGYVAAGDVFSVVCMFTVKNFDLVTKLWTARKTVSFTDTAGVVWEEMRIVIKEIEYDRNFPEYVTATFELWKTAKTLDDDNGE